MFPPNTPVVVLIDPRWPGGTKILKSVAAKNEVKSNENGHAFIARISNCDSSFGLVLENGDSNAPDKLQLMIPWQFVLSMATKRSLVSKQKKRIGYPAELEDLL